jgi:predicted alpha/beta-hydrolase family hydrolase
MNTRFLSFQVSDAIGSVSAEFDAPDISKCMLVFAHGAGAGMNHSFMMDLAYALAEEGIATLRFNFPFTEHKKGRPDTPAVAHKTVEAAIAKAKDLAPELPLFVSGKSFGGRMTSQYLAAQPDPAVQGIIFYGFPLHPAGKPSTERADHLQQVKPPMLFIQGTKDELADWDLVESVCASLPKADLVKIEGADHAFKSGRINTIPILTKATSEWVDKMLGKG